MSKEHLMGLVGAVVGAGLFYFVPVLWAAVVSSFLIRIIIDITKLEDK